MLGYLTPDKSDWEKCLAEKRQLYSQFVNELVLCDHSNQQHDDHVSTIYKNCKRKDVKLNEFHFLAS